MAYCKQCGHDTLMQQEENGSLYQCGYCGYKEHRCPECGSEMKPKEACTSDGHDNSWYVVGWGCKCGYAEKV